jgi:membrane protein required for beta-lactamase induction
VPTLLKTQLCSLLFALCSLLFALCSLLFALCSLLFALCSLLFAITQTSKTPNKNALALHQAKAFIFYI